MKKQKIDRNAVEEKVFYAKESYEDGKKSSHSFMALDPEDFPDKNGWF